MHKWFYRSLVAGSQSIEWGKVKYRRNWRSRYILVLTLILAALSLQAAGRAEKPEQLQATTSDKAKKAAIAAIPFDRLDRQYRQAIHQVVHDCSLYRRMPTEMIDCNPQLFTYLANNPEMLVEMWRELGISQVELERTGKNRFRMTDNAGTTGKLVLVEQNCDEKAQNRIVMYAAGEYEGKPFARPIRAECVLVLRSGSVLETNGRHYVAARLDSFVRIDRTSIKLFAKAMHPWVGKTADRNFTDTMGFISNLSRAAETRPESIEKLVSSLSRLPNERRQQMVEIAYRCGTSTK